MRLKPSPRIFVTPPVDFAIRPVSLLRQSSRWLSELAVPPRFFSVINGVLLRPLPYPDADRLVAVSNVFPKDESLLGLVSGSDVANWRADNHVFDRLEFVSHPDIVAMSGAGFGERVAVQHMTWRLLTMLGIKSFMGTIPDADLCGQRG